ncbi:TPA: hypothetical protein ACJK05_002766 [Salmonella enterica subsp. enterica serovar Thompson]
MGLDIFFLGRDRVCVTDAVVSVPETREVGYFRKVNPLIAWFEKHCGPIENAVERPVSRTELEALLSDLECLTPENCREFFPTGAYKPCTGGCDFRIHSAGFFYRC